MKAASQKKGLILCAGLGTRLRPLTNNHAKPALPVLGIPSLWFSAWHMHKALGLDTLAVNVGHAASTLQQALDDTVLTSSLKTNFFVSDESSQILGSSGVLWKLKNWIGQSTLFATNGDSIFYPDWQKMLSVHTQSKALVTLHVRRFSKQDGQFTDIQVASDGKVLNLGEKKESGLMFSGAYILEPSVLEQIPKGVSELKETVLFPLIKEKKLFAFEENIPWFDTGTVASYVKTQFELLEKEPRFKSLVELKMKKIKAGVWVPKDWNATGLKFESPAVLQGDEKAWAKVATSYGPNFLGIAPPELKKIHTQNAIVMGDFEIKL